MNLNKFFIGIFSLMLIPGISDSAELSKARECTVIELEPEVDPNLTNQENIQHLTEQFFESVNTVQHCEQPNDSAAGGGGAGGGTGGGTGGGAGGGATASSDLSGSEAVISEVPQAVSESTSNAELSSIQEDIDKALGNSSGSTSDEVGASASAEMKDGNNGALPDDIPPADNDSVFEAQIRAAAENETDPEVKKKLWNEYRKYKGLPIKE